MTDHLPADRPAFVHREFTRISRRYELMNQIMTFGMVNGWRRAAIQKLQILPGAIVLDLGAGGGQLADLIRETHPDAKIYPSDFNLPMMKAGAESGLPFSVVDALHIPVESKSVDGVVCAFLLRNIPNYPLALQEILRVLKPGGVFSCLDTTPPADNMLKPLIRLYMRIAIPMIGSILTGRFGAYDYLIRSSESFAPASQLAGEFSSAGFTRVGFKYMQFQTAAVHWGMKGPAGNGK